MTKRNFNGNGKDLEADDILKGDFFVICIIFQ